MTFSETLSWTRYTDNIVHVASTKIGLLRRLRKRLSPLIIRRLYLTCICPSLEYANVAWCGLTKRDQERLEKCNRSAARLITRTIDAIIRNPTQYLTCSSWYPHTSFKTSSGPGQTCFYSNTGSLTCSPSSYLLLVDCAQFIPCDGPTQSMYPFTTPTERHPTEVAILLYFFFVELSSSRITEINEH